jgi:hypothetical protein
MKKNVILIDYENVQNINIELLRSHDCWIRVFHSENQKFSGEYSNLAAELGKPKIEFIQIFGNGKNAADFHIAYFIGKLSKELEAPFFHIISKDTGFKPLVHFLNQNQISCKQESAISDIPWLKAAEGNEAKDHYQKIVELLQKSPVPRPKKIARLRNQIISTCGGKISEENADVIIKRLKNDKIITIQDQSISYLKG